MRFRFDHHHGVFGARDNQIQFGRLQLTLGRVENKVAVLEADTRRANRSRKGGAGQRNGRRGADQGRAGGDDAGHRASHPGRLQQRQVVALGEHLGADQDARRFAQLGQPRLQAIAGAGYESRVYIRADESADYGSVMRVMGRISAAGYGNLGLITDPISQGE